MDDRRQDARKKTFLQGRMLFNGGRSSVDCTVRDMSDSGARLKFSDAVPTPEHFELYIPNRDERRDAYVQWRHNDEVGIAFQRAKAGELVTRPSEHSSEKLNKVDEADKGGLQERLSRLEQEVEALRRLVDEMKGNSRPPHSKSA